MDNITQLVQLIKSHNDTSIESLHSLILQLGLNDQDLQEQPLELSEYFGKGLKMWQYPNQLSKFGNYIANLNIKSYLEIGCRFGGTFIFIAEILAKKNEDIRLYACDMIPMSDILSKYSRIRKLHYLKMSSTSKEFKSFVGSCPPEFVFIDGDHSYAGVKNDFDLCDSLETKYIVLHDIDNDVCPGVKEAWNEIKKDNRFETLEFCDQYESVLGNFLGIGLAIRK
jgi:cephalosporin hydroxylase